MKTIGLVGGMSWESSLVYYRLINEGVKEKLGGFHSCKSVMYSVDFAEIEEIQHQENWKRLGELMIDAARKVEAGGADFIVICTNTMHKLAEVIEENTSIPLLHIADATAEHSKKQGIQRVGLLGTRFTMEQDFYKERLKEKHGIEVIIPEENEREIVHQVIYQELVKGIIRESSREAYLKVIDHLAARGAQGIILGCTEIPLLIRQKDCSVKVFDTTTLHAQYAVETALA